MPGASSDELLARPGEPLAAHLKGVAALAEGWAPEPLKAEARLCGLVHDLYKATPWFQTYLRKGPREQKALQARLGAKLHHAFPSALFGAFVAQRRGMRPLPLFLAVARHHGHLKTPADLLPDPYDPAYLKTPPSKRPYSVVAEQTQALLGFAPARALLAALGFLEDLAAFALEDPAQVAARLRGEAFQGEEDYWRTLTLFSLLIDADKHLAASVTPPPRRPLDESAAEARVRTLPKSGRLAPHRARLFQAVDRKVKTLPLNALFPAALTLTAPTGSGKTLTLLNFALKLRARIARERGLTPRIVYALPLVNLIEQNHRVFEEALAQAGVPREALLAHHHLARLEGDEGEGRSTEEKLLLAEAWEAEIVVTTFVQVVETLFGTQNRTLKKLHRFLSGTILILDEVQAFPAEDWPLIRRLLKAFVARGNTVVLATATQPRLLPEALELAPAFPDYPVRVRLRRAKGPPTEPAHRSRLVVVNTIRRSLEVYQALKAAGDRVYYLSTNLTPKDRLARVEALRALVPHTPLTLVATPIVEAGLDLDFAEGYRELGPVDAVVQVAGRINRSAEREPETLYLIPDEGRARRVYGPILAHLAQTFFEGQSELTDRELAEALARYFDELERRVSQASAAGYLEAMARGRFCRRGYPLGCDRCRHDPAGCDVCCYRLIRDAVRRVPIFVEQDEEASEILAALEAALEHDDPHERRLRLRTLRPEIARYTISPAIDLAAKNTPGPLFGREDFRLIPRDALEAYYDPETGFKWQTTIFDQFL